MREAYFQLMLDEESRDLTTFSDGVTLYRFKRLPFGLNCSPAIFSRRMASLLTPLLRKGWVNNYLDDLIIFAPTFQELLMRLRELFTLLTSNGVKLNSPSSDACNYRPISVTPLLSKIFEHVISGRLSRYLEHSHLIPANQFA